MNEPAAQAAQGGIAAIWASIVTLMVALDLNLALIGFVAALVALVHVKPSEPSARTPLMVFALVAGSAFLALMFTPVAVAIVGAMVPGAGNIDRDSLRWACAATIGGGVHLPWVRARFDKLFGGGNV